MTFTVGLGGALPIVPAAEAGETRLPDVSEDTGSRKEDNTPADSFGSVMQQNLRHGSARTPTAATNCPNELNNSICDLGRSLRQEPTNLNPRASAD
jgi:hypothetical protein